MPRRALALLVTLIALTAGCATRETGPADDAPSPTAGAVSPTATSSVPSEGNESTPPAPEEDTRARCSPPGTPTCDPSGRVVEPAAPGGAEGGAPPPPPGGSASATMRRLDDVGLRVINLTGVAPQGLDVDPATGLVYVANNGAVIAGCNGDAGTAPEPGDAPAPLDEGASTLSVVDPERGVEVARVATGAAPIWTLVDERRHVVHVAGSGDGTVRVHRLGTGELLETIEVGGRPHAFGLHPDTGLLLVSNTNDSSQTFYAIVDAASATLVAQHPAPALPHGISFDAREGVAYMVGVADGTVAVVNMTSGLTIATFDATSRDDANSNMMAFSPISRRIYVSETSPTSSVSVADVDERRIVGGIAFGSPAWGMQVDDERRLLYVALPNLDAVGVADADTLEPLALVDVDDCPYAVRLDTQRGVGYTTGMTGATLSAFDLRKIEAALGR